MSWLRRIRNCMPQEIPGPMAVLYEKAAAPGLCGFHRHVASEITSSLARGRVLDMGTGPGHLLVEVAQRNPDLELMGIDLSRRMLNIARKVTRTHRRSIRLIQGDVRNLPFADGTFDLVVSTLSLHHWHEPARGISEGLRVTSPGGQFWVYDLRTDVPARAHAELLTGSGFARLLRSWIFRFHGVNPKDYAAASVERWLGGGADVRVELQPAYLKLSIHKPPCESQEGISRAGWGRHFSPVCCGQSAVPGVPLPERPGVQGPCPEGLA